MRTGDFDYEVKSTGYTLYYKHRFVGTYIGNEPREGYPGYMSKEEHEHHVIAEIQALIENRGLKIFQDKCSKIDAAFERLRREYETDS